MKSEIYFLTIINNYSDKKITKNNNVTIQIIVVLIILINQLITTIVSPQPKIMKIFFCYCQKNYIKVLIFFCF